MSFIAGYSSDCEYCEVLIKEGDECKMIDYEKKIVAHVVCPTPPPEPPTCEKCFLIHVGECL